MDKASRSTYATDMNFPRISLKNIHLAYGLLAHIPHPFGTY
jgi:hypothetical protein